MLLFSTILKLQETVTPDDLIRLVLEWNDTAKYEENIVSGINWQGEHNVRYGDDKLSLEFMEYPEAGILAVRHEKIKDEGVVWDSAFIADFVRHQISIRLDRTYSEDALVMDAEFSTPHFITLLITHGFLKDDQGIDILNRPVPVNSQNVDLVRKAMEQPESFDLPNVIVTKAADDSDPLNVKILASRLKGAAHVLVEECHGLCTDILGIPEGYENNGAVRIYYPADSVRRKIFHYRSMTGDDAWRLENVIRSVIQYSISQKADPLMTWQGVSNHLLNSQLETQISKRISAESESRMAQEEMTQVYETFDEDLRILQEKVAELTRANEALQYENQGLRAKYAENDETPMLYYGDEKEFFTGEIRDMVLGAVEDALNATEKSTRRADVLEDILNANPCGHLTDERKQRIKTLFKGYKNFTGMMQQELEKMGFEVTGDGKHYKISYKGETRYTVTAAKTPSDVRSGINCAAQMNKMMF